MLGQNESTISALLFNPFIIKDYVTEFMLQNYDESWNDDSPEAFRHHVAEKLGGYLNTIFASSVSNYPV